MWYIYLLNPGNLWRAKNASNLFTCSAGEEGCGLEIESGGAYNNLEPLKERERELLEGKRERKGMREKREHREFILLVG